MSDHKPNPDEKPGWADTPGFRKAFLGVLIVSAIAAALAGLNPAWKNPKAHFEVEAFFAFFAFWGFACFMFIVLVGQHLRKLVGRKEDYYEDRE